MATFPDQELPVAEATAEEAETTEVPTTTIEAPNEVVQGFIDEVQFEMDELTKQIHKSKLAEQFFKRRLKLGKPGEKERVGQLASVQKRMVELAEKYNQQADFIDFLKEVLAERSK